MAKVTIADLDAAGALDGTELVEIEQGGESKQTTTQDIADLGGASYLVYVALLTQTDTDAPVATVLENTLGGTVVWSYDSTGSYYATLAGAFTADKTLVFMQPQTSNISLAVKRDTDDAVYMETTDLSTTPSDELLNGTPIEIRVYP